MEIDHNTRQFVQRSLLPYNIIGVLQVGSSSRGYALATSDIDLMAFYETDGQLIARPLHTDFNGRKITLEHHDIDQFLDDALDHRFNFASLRQLLKVRDGKVIIKGTKKLNLLQELSHRAHLDRNILGPALNACHAETDQIQSLGDEAKRYYMIKWTEIIATLDLLSTRGSAAYSKPKWLYQSLKLAEKNMAIELLDCLYEASEVDSDIIERSVNNIINTYDYHSLDERYHMLFSTAINDALSMLKYKPLESLPGVFFLAKIYYKFFFNADPYENVITNTSFKDHNFGQVFRPKSSSYSAAYAQRLFYEYLGNLHEELLRKITLKCESAIGSTRFANYLVDHYDLFNIMPYSSNENQRELLAGFEFICE